MLARKMTSLINDLADWPPLDYHKTARTFQWIGWLQRASKKCSITVWRYLIGETRCQDVGCFIIVILHPVVLWEYVASTNRRVCHLSHTWRNKEGRSGDVINDNRNQPAKICVSSWQHIWLALVDVLGDGGARAGTGGGGHDMWHGKVKERRWLMSQWHFLWVMFGIFFAGDYRRLPNSFRWLFLQTIKVTASSLREACQLDYLPLVPVSGGVCEKLIAPKTCLHW